MEGAMEETAASDLPAKSSCRRVWRVFAGTGADGLTCSTSIFSLDRKQENSLDAWPGGAAAYRKSYDARKRLLPSLYQTPSIAGTSFSIQVHDKCDNITTKAI
jgi:hypothetical protein